jgi:hypothetical protein
MYLEHIAHNWLYPRIIWMLEDTISEPCMALIVCRNLWKQDKREKIMGFFITTSAAVHDINLSNLPWPFVLFYRGIKTNVGGSLHTYSMAIRYLRE